MSWARREAGPPDPAAAPRGRTRKLLSHLTLQTGSSRGHGAAPAGKAGAASPWRRLALLPCALLAGALCLFDAAPAQAQTVIWSATLTADEVSGIYYGCDNSDASQDSCSDPSVLTDDNFTYSGSNYEIVSLYWRSSFNWIRAYIRRGTTYIDGAQQKEALGSLVLLVDGTALAVSDATAGINYLEFSYDPTPDWVDGQQVAVKLVEPPPLSSLTLSASDTAPREGGGPVTVTATLDQPAPDGLQVNVLLRGTATWGEGNNWPAAWQPPGPARGDGSQALAAGADYWTPAPSGVERGFWFGEASASSVQAINLLKIPAGQRSASFEVHVLDDTHNDNGETIEIEAQAYENIPYTARLNRHQHQLCTLPANQFCDVSASWMKHLTGVSDTLTLTIQNDENAETEAARLAALAAAEAERQRLAALRAAAGGPLSGLALTAGSQAVALVPAFSPGVTSYRAEVPLGTAAVSLSPSWGAEAELRGSPSVLALSRGGATILARTEVDASGGAAALSLSPSVPTRLELTVIEPDGSGQLLQGTTTTYHVEVVGAAPQTATAGGPLSGLALTAGSQAVALVPAFSPGVTRYRAEVPAGTREVSLSPSWGAEAERGGSPTVWARSRRPVPHLTLLSRQRVGASGTAAALSLSPDGPTRLEVVVSEPGLRTTDYRIEVVEAAAAQTVTVAFSNVPPEHDGRTAFALEVQSGSEPAADAFTVTNGKVTGVESLDPVLWRVRVKPKSWKDVTVALGAASATVRGPARIRVADAKGREGKDETLDFAVTLNRAAAGAVSVDYATEDGTATAGADYTAVSGTLTFAAGETAKTVSVALLDDAVDEGKETFKLKLSNPRGAYLRAMHREAKGVIRNADPLPSAWQIRFGRSVSQQVVDALQQRFSTTTTPSGLQLTLAGETLTSDTPLEENHVLLSRLLGFESVSSQEVAQGSSFSFSPEGAGPRLSFWGKGALSSFNGVEESTTLTGDVTTALLGAEWNNERWRAGAALSHSWGNGSYQGEGDGADGRISSTLTGIFPYGRYALTPRLGVWATAGYGWGSLSLNPDGDAPEYNPATTMTLGAVGMDGLLLDGGSEGVTLTTTADALFLKTTSEAVVGLASSEGNISRLRLGLEATRPFPLSNGASLSPSLEVGLRQDSGDAETGFGMDLGAGLSWSAPQQGITAAVKGRTLLSHGAEDFQDQGLALSFSWQPSPSNRGASLSLSHAVGLPADGGMAALLNPTAIELPDDTNSDGEQFEARLAYGFPFYNNRLTLTPSVAAALSTNSRTYSLLWSVAPYAQQAQDDPWQLSLEGERHENLSSPTVDHSLKLRFALPL